MLKEVVDLFPTSVWVAEKDSDLICDTDDPENEIHKEFWKSQNVTFTCFKKLLNNL